MFGTFGVFSGAHIRHDHKQYCLSSSDPAGKDIWAGLFMVEIFLFPIGEALPKTQQTRESSVFDNLTLIGRRPHLTQKVKAVQWVGGANYSYLHFNFMLAEAASAMSSTSHLALSSNISSTA